MASLDDILTTQKNGVIAINNLANYTRSILAIDKSDTTPSGAATTSTSIIYTVPAGQQFTLTDIEVCNTSASSTTFTIYLVASGGTASTGNALFYSAPIGGYTTVQWSGTTALAAGSTIQASAGTTNVSIKIGGAAL